MISTEWWFGYTVPIICLYGPAQIKNMLVLTFPLVVWAMGPSNILQECWNFWYSSKINPLFFHFRAKGSVTFAKLKELYSFTITGLPGFEEFTTCAGACCWCTGSGGGGGSFWSWPPVAWFINNSAWMCLLSVSNSQSIVVISLRIAAQTSGSWAGDWVG